MLERNRPMNSAPPQTALRATFSPARSLRVAALLAGGVGLVVAVGFVFQAPWASGLWPWLTADPYGNPGLSSVFLGSIALAISVPTLWIGLSGELAATTGGALNLLVTAAGLAGSLWTYYVQSGDGDAHTGALVCLGAALVLLGLLLVGRHRHVHDPRPMPRLVRLSFGLFAGVLAALGILLLSGQPVYPWDLDAQTAALYGWIYLGAACYFAYGVLRPRWANACGQLLGFLAYDLVLLPAFLGYFSSVDEAHRLSLTIYTAVLVYSAALAGYYLFVDKRTRGWRVGRTGRQRTARVGHAGPFHGRPG
jgi:hypothetical protein